MHLRKRQYANEVYNLVNQLCASMSVNKEMAIPEILHVSTNDALDIIKKIIIALPDRLFYNATPVILYDMLVFVSKNLILFQVQEHIDEENYTYHLLNFIQDLCLSITNRYYVHEGGKA